MIMEYNHEQWTELMKSFYNRRFKELGVASAQTGPLDPADRGPGHQAEQEEPGVRHAGQALREKRARPALDLLRADLQEHDSAGAGSARKDEARVHEGKRDGLRLFRASRPLQVHERSLRPVYGLPGPGRPERHPESRPEDALHIPKRVQGARQRGRRHGDGDFLRAHELERQVHLGRACPDRQSESLRHFGRGRDQDGTRG